MTIQISKINADYSTCPQLTEADIPEVATLGFKSIINHRPDGEGGADQPHSNNLRIAAEKAGLAYLYVPVIPGNITPENIAACSAFLKAAPTPILGFCKTGMRAASLYRQASDSSAAQGGSNFAKACAWMKNKCLIRRLWRKLTGADSCKVCSL